MIPADVHGHVNVHDVAIFEGSALLRVRTVSGSVSEKKFNSLIRDPVTENVVDARTT